MDQELSKEYKRRQRIKKLLSALAGAFLIAITLFGFRTLIKPEIAAGSIMISVAETGSLEAVVSASGIVVPRYEQVITSPVQTNIISIYHKAGEKIKTGDQIIKLNKEFLLLNYEKLKDELELKKVEKLKKELSLKNSDAERKTNFSIKELNTRYNEAKFKRQEHLYKIGGATIESMEEARLNLEISEKDKENLKSQMDNQLKLQQAELNELDLQIRIGEKSLKEIKRQLELADVVSNSDGIITWVNENIGSAISAGEKIAAVSDLSSFQVEASISDIHASSLYTGCPVKIKFNDTVLKGSIISINPAVSNGIITFRVSLSDSSNPLLRPNMRVEVYVITSVKENIVRVKNGPFYNSSPGGKIFVAVKGKAVRRTVEFGDSDFDYVEIKKGIKPGDKVIISDMKNYEDMEEVKINYK